MMVNRNNGSDGNDLQCKIFIKTKILLSYKNMAGIIVSRTSVLPGERDAGNKNIFGFDTAYLWTKSPSEHIIVAFFVLCY